MKKAVLINGSGLFFLRSLDLCSVGVVFASEPSNIYVYICLLLIFVVSQIFVLLSIPFDSRYSCTDIGPSELKHPS